MHKIISLFLVLVVTSACVAQTSGQPTTKEERQRAIQLATKLEANPLDESLRPDREWLLKWAAEASDFTVSICAGKGEYKKKYKYSPELTFQKLASGTAYVVQHTDRPADKVAQELAAVTGALNAYEVILKANPKAHSEYWDELLKKRSDGTLETYVRDYVNNECSGKKA